MRDEVVGERESTERYYRNHGVFLGHIKTWHNEISQKSKLRPSDTSPGHMPKGHSINNIHSSIHNIQNL